MNDQSVNRSHVVIDVVEGEVPPRGIAQLVIKLTGPDKDAVDTAAKLSGRTQQDFMRSILVNASRKYLALHGVDVTLTGKYIDLSATDD